MKVLLVLSLILCILFIGRSVNKMNRLLSFFVSITIINIILTLNTASSSAIVIGEKTPITIQMVAALFRHGDRSPTELYPKDPHINYEWPGGLGALSQKGALQHYNLGKKLRARYHQLLPKNGQYTKDEISVVSSYAERCLMSAQSLLAGFMPPLENKNLLPIEWQPIPVSSIPRNMDNLLAQKKPCQKYDNLLKSLYRNPPPDLKKMNDENQDLYRLLTKRTGQNITKCSDIKALYDTLLIERNAGLILPDWTENIFPEKMIPFAERCHELITETPYMKKVKGGSFITEVLKNMIDKQKNTLNPDRSIFLYFAHKHTLVNVINSLNIVNQTARLHEYASALIFELHENPVLINDLEIKLFYYRNSEVNTPKEVNIPKCDRPCSLMQFSEIFNRLLVDNFDEICENLKIHSSSC